MIVRIHAVVVPKQLWEQILNELHTGHFGIVKMKTLARNYCWWPGNDADSKKLANVCKKCLFHRNNSPEAAKHVWGPATALFERVPVNFAGPFWGWYFFVN